MVIGLSSGPIQYLHVLWEMSGSEHLVQAVWGQTHGTTTSTGVTVNMLRLQCSLAVARVVATGVEDWGVGATRGDVGHVVAAETGLAEGVDAR